MIRSKKSLQAFAALASVAALTLSACGSSDDNKSDNASASSDTAAAASNSGGDVGDFCGARAAFSAGANTSTAPDVNALKKAADNVDKAVQYAPSEIKPDVRIVVDASKPFFELLASVDYDFTKLMSDQSKAQQLQSLGEKYNEDKVSAAAQRVNAWVEAHCE